MIQRVQTIFLFFAVVGVMVQVFFPVLSATPMVPESLYQDGLLFIRENTIAFCLLIVSGILALVAIFMFKNHKLQIQLILGAISVLMICLAVSLFAFSNTTQTIYSSRLAVLSPELGIIMPWSGFIFLALALRYVKKDQKIIKSMDRLR
ncbi:MAG: DUF4293 domain-containing protein [Saprospiraceae bacterium]|nr:DUF4293 domain-containing protein [Saprospiraceae bacterium]